jgi:TRAP transporter TAXI family solute receptor
VLEKKHVLNGSLKIKRGLFSMKMKLLLLGLVLILALAGCGSTEEPASSDSGVKDEAKDEVKDEVKDEAVADMPTSITVGTASQGGLYFVYGGGLANLINEHIGVPASVEVTGGPVHNVQLTHMGDQQIGLATAGPLYEGYTGTGSWTEGKVYDNIRVIFPMYTTYFHWIALQDSGIDSIDDLQDVRVGAGPSGGTPGTYLPLIHEELGLNTDDVHAGASDLAGQIVDGQLDVTGWAAGVPTPFVVELALQRDINIFGIDGDQRDQIIKKFPFFNSTQIPAGAYEDNDEPIETIALFNFGISNKDVSADFIYEVVKMYHERNDDMQTVHSAAKEAVEEAILFNTAVPLHVGAIRYYEEIGIDLPESVYPEEWNK